jgi:hypothetical protein
LGHCFRPDEAGNANSSQVSLPATQEEQEENASPSPQLAVSHPPAYEPPGIFVEDEDMQVLEEDPDVSFLRQRLRESTLSTGLQQQQQEFDSLQTDLLPKLSIRRKSLVAAGLKDTDSDALLADADCDSDGPSTLTNNSPVSSPSYSSSFEDGSRGGRTENRAELVEVELSV